MSLKSINPFSVAPVVACLVLAIGVVTVFSACGMKEDGTWMHCHDAQNAVAYAASALTVVLAIAALVKNRVTKVVLYALGVLGSAATFAIPGIIMPLCMMQTMRCYTVMQPFVRVMTVIVMALCLVAAVRAWKSTAEGQKPRRGSDEARGR